MKFRSGLTVSVIGRITVFLYLFTILALILYIQGSFQDFTDSSLIMLLFLYKFTSLIFIALGFSYIVILIIDRPDNKYMARRIIITSAGIFLSSAVYLAVQILITGLEPVL